VCKYFRKEDIALVIKYVFDEQYEPETFGQKRKRVDKKNENVLTYSQIKLPGLIFLKYLENYLSDFLKSCMEDSLRYKASKLCIF